MAPLAHLMLAACALIAPLHAASIPDTTSELHRKIPAVLPEDIKDPVQAEPGHELVDVPEPVKQIENELRVKPTEDIPVEVVVVNNEQSAKINEVADEDDIVRPEVDLRNPGPPQRQEHETQNPEQHSEEQLRVSTIRKSIEETQKLLKQSFQDVTSDIQGWFSDNEGQIKIQQNIQNLRDTFTSQIQKLNDTIQSLAKPEDSKPTELQMEESQRDFQKIESRLKVLEDNFNSGVQTLSAGVDIIAGLRSGADPSDEVRQEESAPPAPPALTAQASPAADPAPTAQPAPAQPAPPQPTNILLQVVGALYNRTREGIASVQNLILPQSSNPPSDVQADQPAARPPWAVITEAFNPQNPPWSSLFGQNGQNGPFNLGQYFGQNNQNGLFGVFNNIFPTPKPTDAATGNKPSESKPEAAAEKPADVAASPPVVQSAPQPATAQPVASPTAQAQPVTAQPVGPIRQFLNNNPITQGLVTTVQRIQNSITNSETPRVPVAEKTDSLQKGGWYGGGKPGGGDNNDSGLIEKKTEEVKEKEPIPEEPKKEVEVKEEVKPQPQVIVEKTE